MNEEYSELFEKLRLSILKLLNNNSLRFFGYLLYNIDFEIIETKREDDENYDEFEDLQYNENKNTHLIYNKTNNKFKLQIEKQYLNENKIPIILFTIIHNILHILNKHNIRSRGKDPILYNIAADHVINNELSKSFYKDELPDIKLPYDIDKYIINSLRDRDLTTEEVYEWCLKQQNQNKAQNKEQVVSKSIIQNPNDSQDKKEQNDNNSDNNQNQNNQDKKETKETEKSGSRTIGYKTYYTEKNLEEIQEFQQEAINKLNEMGQSAALLLEQGNSSKGNIGGNLLEYLKKITKVEVPWFKLLERAILVNTAPNPDSRIWTNPMKRLRAHNIILPGPGIDKSLDMVGIIIDTSGSISQKNLQIFAGICINSFTKFKKLWLLKHDTQITTNEIIDMNQVNKEEIISKTIGRGGTSHRLVFNEIEKRYKDKSLKLGLLLFLTDFYSDIEQIWTKYEWTKYIPSIFLLTSSVKVPEYIDKNPIYIKDILS